ncbi:MAG: agmatine deiminase family protein [Campylobacteraceae bacterium]|jgi:agmatine/peptidylarginine deiminase|nr:agmatine deiminase family protein [Campylobacteraceae bacterium]
MTRLFAEWEKQEALLFALPHENTDWNRYIDEILHSYRDFILAVSKFQKCFVLCADIKKARSLLRDIDNVTLIKIQTNDTWIRDFGAIDVQIDDEVISYDFTFNAWGGKFDASLDNLVNKTLHKSKNLQGELLSIPLVLEGGSIDSNGKGVMLTTTKCLLEKHRNPHLSHIQIDAKLKELFGLTKIIWLENGYLKGDDTDSHVDTLARFITQNTIAYTICEDETDEHFLELKRMEEELKNTGFDLLPLPLPKPIFYEGHRLPATYANFVFVNNALIVPIYEDKNDERVLSSLKNALPNHEIVGVNAKIFIREHGSLHCATMNRYERKAKQNHRLS